MPELPRLNVKDVISALQRAGFYIHHQKGSHVHLRHADKPRLRVTIPYHTHFDLPLFVIKNILKQSEVALADFIKLL